MGVQRTSFWERYPGLVWSNRNASDQVYIRAALLKPRFSELLEIALEFGLDRVQREWGELQLDETQAVHRARPLVDRILVNIGKGFEIASTRN